MCYTPHLEKLFTNNVSTFHYFKYTTFAMIGTDHPNSLSL